MVAGIEGSIHNTKAWLQSYSDQSAYRTLEERTEIKNSLRMSKLKGTLKPNRVTAKTDMSLPNYDFAFSDDIERWMITTRRRANQQSYSERKAVVKRSLNNIRMTDYKNKMGDL